MFKYVLILLCVMGFTANTRADDDSTTVRLFNAQTTMALKGNAQAQYYLGEMYELGLGTPENPAQAIVWYRKAAAQNHPMAQRKLRELTADAPPPAAPLKTKVEAPAPALAPLPEVAPAPPKAPPVVAKPAPARTAPAGKSKDDAAKQAQAAREAEAARAAEAKQAAAAARQARLQAEAKAKQEAADKEKRKALARAALERMKADAKKNGMGY